MLRGFRRASPRAAPLELEPTAASRQAPGNAPDGGATFGRRAPPEPEGHPYVHGASAYCGHQLDPVTCMLDFGQMITTPRAAPDAQPAPQLRNPYHTQDSALAQRAALYGAGSKAVDLPFHEEPADSATFGAAADKSADEYTFVDAFGLDDSGSWRDETSRTASPRRTMRPTSGHRVPAPGAAEHLPMPTVPTGGRPAEQHHWSGAPVEELEDLEDFLLDEEPGLDVGFVGFGQALKPRPIVAERAPSRDSFRKLISPGGPASADDDIVRFLSEDTEESIYAGR